MANGSQDIEFNKGGIKLSYLRFLSDSASGYLAILILIFLYYYNICGVSIKESLNYNISFVQSGNIPNEIIFFVFFLLFLLGTPLGLVINATSWVLLGWLQVRSEEFWVNHTFLIGSTKKKYLFDNCVKFYDLDKSNWYCKSNLFEQVLLIYYPDVLKNQNHVEGVINLLRNIIFLGLCSSILYCLIILFMCPQLMVEILIHNLKVLLILVILLILLILLLIFLIVTLSLVSFYYDLCVLFNGYLLHQRKNLYHTPKIIDLDNLAKSDEFCPKSKKKLGSKNTSNETRII